MSASLSSAEVWLVVVGLTAITVLTRCFFFLSAREITMPDWLRRGLRYAPLAALAAVVVPEIVMVQGALTTAPWRDARVYSAGAAMLYFFGWRRDILGTIITGMLVLLPLRIGLGW